LAIAEASPAQRPVTQANRPCRPGIAEILFDAVASNRSPWKRIDLPIGGLVVHLRKLTVEGFRAAGHAPIVCNLPGRFSLLLGANGAGKTTVSEAIYQGHPHRFPRLSAPDAAAG
jgi:hypothetical protein